MNLGPVKLSIHNWPKQKKLKLASDLVFAYAHVPLDFALTGFLSTDKRFAICTSFYDFKSLLTSLAEKISFFFNHLNDAGSELLYNENILLLAQLKIPYLI